LILAQDESAIEIIEEFDVSLIIKSVTRVAANPINAKCIYKPIGFIN
jgi:hypothetical protein